MNTIFMNFKNSKISDPYRLLLNLKDKLNLTTVDKYVALSNINVYHSSKKIKSYIKTMNLKFQS